MALDEDLVVRFRDHGDERAFNELVLRHQNEVYRLAQRMVRDHDAAHDLAQEAFVRVYKSIDRFRGDSAFRTWLYRIVVNVSLNHIKRSKREHEGQVAFDSVDLSVPERALHDLVQAERESQVQMAIDKLPEKQKKTLILKVFHDLKYTEIAGIMKCSVGTAKANFFHAVQRLRREINVGNGHSMAEETT